MRCAVKCTIKDVAKAAGVSPSTVSRALHNNPRISEQARERIRALAKEMGFHPNQMARSLVNRRTRVIGIVFPANLAESLGHPFYPQVLQGLGQTAAERRHYVLLGTGQGGETTPEAIRQLVDSGYVSGLVLLAALKPVMRTNWGRLFVFAVTLYTPASWAENTLRVYRDNIYPSLVLLALAGLLGAFTRFREKPLRALPYYVAAGLSLAAAWLCHEDNALLLPFVLCAAAVYLAYLFLDKSIAHKKSRLALLLVPLALWGGGIAAWCGMNYKYYGRFIISDFTSSEFNDAMGALSRAYPDDQKRYELIPLSTRLALYEVSPTFAKLQDVLETPEMYNGYGDPETGELNSGGIHWVLRKAAWTAGYYDTAQDAENFWRAVADEINAACDAGLVPAGRRHSGVFSPIKAEYVAPTIGKFFDEVKVFVLFEQTEPTQILSIARPDQTEEWESYLHCQSTIAAQANTDLPYFAPLNQIAYKLLNLVTWVQRILLWPMLLLTVLWLVRYAPACVRGLKKKQPPADLAGSVLMLGFFLTGLLRMAAIAYLMAVTLSFDIYLMYLSAACAPMLAFLAYGTAKWFEGHALSASPYSLK